MNAYELAEKWELSLDVWDDRDYTSWCYDASSMLRQQADRIAELEKDLALKTRDRDVFRDFTLAYEKRIEELEKLEQDFIRVIKQTNPNKPQTKPLSDEEIMEIFKAYEQMQEYGYVGKKPFQVHLGWSLEDKNSCLMLARAILRKAQEK